MNENQLHGQLAELGEQVESFFSRKTEIEGKAALTEHCNKVLEQLPEMNGLLRDYPVYGAIAFLGRFHFVDCPEVKTLAKSSSAETLEAIRVKKAVKIDESAQPAWVQLRDNEPETACAILAICFLASKKKAITKRLKP